MLSLLSSLEEGSEDDEDEDKFSTQVMDNFQSVHAVSMALEFAEDDANFESVTHEMVECLGLISDVQPVVKVLMAFEEPGYLCLRYDVENACVGQVRKRETLLDFSKKDDKLKENLEIMVFFDSAFNNLLLVVAKGKSSHVADALIMDGKATKAHERMLCAVAPISLACQLAADGCQTPSTDDVFDDLCFWFFLQGRKLIPAQRLIHLCASCSAVDMKLVKEEGVDIFGMGGDSSYSHVFHFAKMRRILVHLLHAHVYVYVLCQCSTKINDNLETVEGERKKRDKDGSFAGKRQEVVAAGEEIVISNNPLRKEKGGPMDNNLQVYCPCAVYGSKQKVIYFSANHAAKGAFETSFAVEIQMSYSFYEVVKCGTLNPICSPTFPDMDSLESLHKAFTSPNGARVLQCSQSLHQAVFMTTASFRPKVLAFRSMGLSLQPKVHTLMQSNFYCPSENIREKRVPFDVTLHGFALVNVDRLRTPWYGLPLC